MMVRSGPREKIRPLWILFSDRWSGPEQVFLSDIVELAKNGIPVQLVCLENSPVHAAALRNAQEGAGISIVALAGGPKHIWDFSFSKHLRRIIFETKSNIVHFNDDFLLLFLRMALRGNKEVSLIQNKNTISAGGFLRALRSFGYRRVDYMMVLSETVRKGLIQAYAIPERKIKVVNLGIDFTKFNLDQADPKKIRDQWGADKDTTVVGTVGQMVENSGLTTFIKAAATLLRVPDRKMYFVLVSEDEVVESDTYIEELRDLTKQFHIEDKVLICSLGDKLSLPDAISAFDIYVTVGVEDVPGLGALEALAMQRPAVLSNNPGAEDIVGNKKFGLLVRRNDAFDLQQKILNLLENPSLRLTMGSAGRQNTLKHYDKQIRLLRTLDIYEKCIKRRYAAGERKRA
jgi:glycosyltransferase involved in cell wall biosynthesis